jgi:hypothetical protein
MSTHEIEPTPTLGRSLEEPRDAVLARAVPLPPRGEMIIEGLTDQEEQLFLDAIAEA